MKGGESMSHYFTDNRQLPQNRKDISFRFSCFDLVFTSDNGVFSKDKIDEGSQILLQALLDEELGDKILDVGSGIGVLGITLKKCYPQMQVDMVEINPRAVELSQINAKQNKCLVNIIQSDLYHEVSNCNYSSIITNPPIRAGKQVIYAIFDEAFDYLKQEGCLFVVIRKSHGALSAQNHICDKFGKCEIIYRDKGYFILKAVKRG